MASPENLAQVQTIYIAYYGRPADPGGLLYWCDRLDAAGGNVDAIIDAFGNSQEFIDNFGSFDNEALVNNLFVQMFNRDAEQAGLDFYVDLLESGAKSLASIALDIANGAQNEDLAALDNKGAFADAFTSSIDETGAPYTQDQLADVKELMSRVTDDPGTIDDATLFADRYVETLLGTADDDYSDDASTTGSIDVNGLEDGRIQSVADDDWFAVELEADQTYAVELRGYSNDPIGAGVTTLVLSVFDADGEPTGALANGTGQDPRAELSFTATSSGKHFISARGGDYWQGQYVLGIELISENPEDDFAGDDTTTGAIAVDQEVFGSIEFDGDTDWFAVELEAEREYTFDLRGADSNGGTLGDPWLGLHDADGDLVDKANDGGTGRDSRLVFTPAASGTYFLSAEENGNNAQGTYALSASVAPIEEPEPTETTVILADNPQNSNLNVDPAEDLPLDTYLNYDLVTNTAIPQRLTIQQLSAIADGNGNPYDRTDIPEGRNIGVFSYNLGADINTVDYGAETGDIAALIRLDMAEPVNYVLIDNNRDGDFVDNGDRLDEMSGITRLVASSGDSTLDLTQTGSDIEVVFRPETETDDTTDTITMAVELTNLETPEILPTSFVEHLDAELNPEVPAFANAQWNGVQGSDNAEIIVSNSVHSLSDDTFVLRGGANELKYNELTRSITVGLSVSDFDPAAPTATGLVSGTITFQDGNGGALLNGGTHSVTSHTADNPIAGGSLLLAGSQDAEDTFSVTGAAGTTVLLAQQGVDDNQVTVTLDTEASEHSVILTGFERIEDDATNDTYDMGALVTVRSNFVILDNAANDHDVIIVRSDAIGFNGAGTATISLATINTGSGGFNFDFDVLDITNVVSTGLILAGEAAGEGTDELVIGAPTAIAAINDFESVVFSEASVAQANQITLDTAANALSVGSTTIPMNNDNNSLSFSGLMYEGEFGESYLANVTRSVMISVTGTEDATVFGGDGSDTINGGQGSDLIRGGRGGDTINGGEIVSAVEVHRYLLSGNWAVGTADSSLTVNGFTVAEGATVQGVLVPDGAITDQIGEAFEREFNANPASFDDDAILDSVEYDSLTDELIFTFTAAAGNVADNELGAPTVVPGSNGGSFAITTETVLTQFNPGGETSDTYVFESSGLANGLDTLSRFNSTDAVTDDLLDFTAFLGGAALPFLTPENFVTSGLNLTGAGDVGVIFNKASLGAGDVATSPSAGKVAIEDNSVAVVLTTADTDGLADGTNEPYRIYFIEDTDLTAAQNFNVTLVGILNSPSELNAADFFGTTDAFV